MVLAWNNYLTDTGYNYPFIPISIKLLSEFDSQEFPLFVLPETDRQFLINIDNACSVPQLTPRKIKIFKSDDSVYEFNYPRIFSRELFDWLSSSISVRAFELIGESVKYSRLIKMLNRG